MLLLNSTYSSPFPWNVSWKIVFVHRTECQTTKLHFWRSSRNAVSYWTDKIARWYFDSPAPSIRGRHTRPTNTIFPAPTTPTCWPLQRRIVYFYVVFSHLSNSAFGKSCQEPMEDGMDFSLFQHEHLVRYLRIVQSIIMSSIACERQKTELKESFPHLMWIWMETEETFTITVHRFSDLNDTMWHQEWTGKWWKSGQIAYAHPQHIS